MVFASADNHQHSAYFWSNPCTGRKHNINLRESLMAKILVKFFAAETPL